MWGKWEDVKSEYESKVNDPWDWVTHFENAVARYTGAKHAIACDSASNAIKLCLNYVKEAKSIKIPKGSKMYIPANTYVSVPNQITLISLLRDLIKCIPKIPPKEEEYNSILTNCLVDL